MELILNSNAIQHETDSAILIKLPKSDMKFWHPTKMCKLKGKGGYQLVVWFPHDNWEIKAKRTSDKTGNVLEEATYSPSEMAESYNIPVK